MTPWYKSKQFYFNVLTVLITVAAAFGFQEFTPDPRAAVIAQLLVAIVNVVLRFAFPSPPPSVATPKGAALLLPQPGEGRGGLPIYRATNIRAALGFAALTLAVVTGIALT